MRKGRRDRRRALLTRLERHLEISLDSMKPRRIRTRAARYAAALAERLGMLVRPKLCSWCRRHRRLERHHWDYSEPLNVTFLCFECHDLADEMVVRAAIA
jgi:hypothetical protein